MKLSIVTINRNNAAGLVRTIDSVRSQDFRDFEHIVIDGASTDGSVEAIRARAGALQYWVSEPDAGIYAAMNKGLRKAQGEYVQFLNSGDWLSDGQVLDRVFGEGMACEDLLYGDHVRVEKHGRTKRFEVPDALALSQFRGQSIICHQAAFYRRNLFAELGPYNEANRLVSDWEFNLRILLADKSTRRLPFVVACCSAEGLSVTQAEVSLAEQAAVLARLLPLAVRRDYERLQSLEAECRRLRAIEDWARAIPQRNSAVNYAMVTYWLLKRMRRVFTRRSPRAGS